MTDASRRLLLASVPAPTGADAFASLNMRRNGGRSVVAAPSSQARVPSESHDDGGGTGWDADGATAVMSPQAGSEGDGAAWMGKIARLEGAALEGEEEFMRGSPCTWLPVRGRPVSGHLSCSSYRLRFDPASPHAGGPHLQHLPLSFFSVPLLSLRSVRKIMGTPECPAPAMDLAVKDGRHLRLAFARETDCDQVLRIVSALAFPARVEDTFAFSKTVAALKKSKSSSSGVATAAAAAAVKSKSSGGDPLGVRSPVTGVRPVPDRTPFDEPEPVVLAEPESGPRSVGWDLFDFRQEFVRIGALPPSGSSTPTGAWRVSTINESYQFSPTYPSVMCVPATFSDREIGAIQHFRSRGRIPAMTWRHPGNGATMWRSSQPRVGVTNATNAEDERLLSLIRLSTPQGRDGRAGLVIADCRPRANAVANKMGGWGYEGTTYVACHLWFLDIENIHRMRESQGKLEGLVQDGSAETHWGRAVEGTLWPTHIRAVLAGAMRVAHALHRRGTPVLVHCSDGWDRTAQICGLVQLFLDPYSRTLEGFASLIEKEWLAFGHKFQCRLAHGNSKAADDKEASPVFLQFLDCTAQLCMQFPAAFEFTQRLPLFLAHHCTSGRYGTFLFNCERERKAARLSERTDSVWDDVFRSRGLFLSPFYRPAAFAPDGSHPVILPSHPAQVLRQVRLWDEYFMRFSPVPLRGPMQGIKAALVGGGPMAAKHLVEQLDSSFRELWDAIPIEEMPQAIADATPLDTVGSREGALFALRALAASGLAVGAEDAMLEVLAAIRANAAGHRVTAAATSAGDQARVATSPSVDDERSDGMSEPDQDTAFDEGDAHVTTDEATALGPEAAAELLESSVEDVLLSSIIPEE
jgi:hypothetical protein